MLEQQQAWLVQGLQELYQLAHRGSAWPGPPLKPESNGQPLTHDLLMHLGALDRSKGERFEENTTLLQQELYRRNPTQSQNGSNGSNGDAVRSPATGSGHNQEYRSLANALGNQQLPPTPSSHSPPQRPQIKTEPITGSDYVPVLTPPQPPQLPMSPVDVVEPSALQWNSTWTTQPTMPSYEDIGFMNQDMSGAPAGEYIY